MIVYAKERRYALARHIFLQTAVSSQRLWNVQQSLKVGEARKGGTYNLRLEKKEEKILLQGGKETAVVPGGGRYEEPPRLFSLRAGISLWEHIKKTTSSKSYCHVILRQQSRHLSKNKNARRQVLDSEQSRSRVEQRNFGYARDPHWAGGWRGCRTWLAHARGVWKGGHFPVAGEL